MVFQKRWSLMAVVSQNRYHCIWYIHLYVCVLTLMIVSIASLLLFLLATGIIRRIQQVQNSAKSIPFPISSECIDEVCMIPAARMGEFERFYFPLYSRCPHFTKCLLQLSTGRYFVLLHFLFYPCLTFCCDGLS